MENKKKIIIYKRLIICLVYTILFFFEAFLNMLVVAYNQGYMPVFGEFEGLYTEMHKPIVNFDNVRFKLLSDIIPAIKGRISIGDVLMIFSFFGLIYNFYLYKFKDIELLKSIRER